MRIAIIGTGTWGTALAQTLVENGHDVLLYGNSSAQVEEINHQHQNTRYFGPELFLSPQIKATINIEEALHDRSIIVLAVPTGAIREVLRLIRPHLTTRRLFVNTAKGLEKTTNLRMSEVINEEIPPSLRFPLVSLLGPSHAEEVIMHQLTAITATCRDIRVGRRIQKLFSNHYFRVYTLKDEVGAELGAALKNAIAIASGILAGLGYGDNARAALVSRGLKEIIDFGVHFGGQRATFIGLTGLGDLVVTCNSHHSRNFQAGFQIGQADDAQVFLATNTQTVEGIKAIDVVHQIAENIKLEMPIINALYSVLYQNCKPSEKIFQLMFRPLKDETPVM